MNVRPCSYGSGLRAAVDNWTPAWELVGELLQNFRRLILTPKHRDKSSRTNQVGTHSYEGRQEETEWVKGIELKAAKPIMVENSKSRKVENSTKWKNIKIPVDLWRLIKTAATHQDKKMHEVIEVKK